jgi:hypothetical protein
VTNYVTKTELELPLRGQLVKIPALTPVEPARPEHYGPQDSSPFYWVKPSLFPRNSIERWDAEHYGVRVPAEDVEPVIFRRHEAG